MSENKQLKKIQEWAESRETHNRPCPVVLSVSNRKGTDDVTGFELLKEIDIESFEDMISKIVMKGEFDKELFVVAIDQLFYFVAELYGFGMIALKVETGELYSRKDFGNKYGNGIIDKAISKGKSETSNGFIVNTGDNVLIRLTMKDIASIIPHWTIEKVGSILSKIEKTREFHIENMGSYLEITRPDDYEQFEGFKVV